MEPAVSDDRRLAARVAACAEIRDIRLFSAGVKLTNFEPPNGHLRYGVELDAEVNHEPGDEQFVLKTTYSVVIGPVPDDEDGEEQEEPESIAEITFELGGLFSLDERGQAEDIEPAEFEAFAKTTGQMALWPFAREFVFDATGRLGLPPLAIGVFRVPLQADEVSAKLVVGSEA